MYYGVHVIVGTVSSNIYLFHTGYKQSLWRATVTHGMSRQSIEQTRQEEVKKLEPVAETTGDQTEKKGEERTDSWILVWHGDKEKERDKEGIKEAEVAGDDWEVEDRVKIDRDLADSGYYERKILSQEE